MTLTVPSPQAPYRSRHLSKVTLPCGDRARMRIQATSSPLHSGKPSAFKPREKLLWLEWSEPPGGYHEGRVRYGAGSSSLVKFQQESQSLLGEVDGAMVKLSLLCLPAPTPIFTYILCFHLGNLGISAHVVSG